MINFKTQCSGCGKYFVLINPPIEDYSEYLFVIKIPFIDWKFCLIKDKPEYGCLECRYEKENDRVRDIYLSGVQEGIEKAIKENFR